MEIEIFTMCDYAADYGGKLVINGTFDVINTKQLPAIHPSLSIATRIRFGESEFVKHKFKIRFIDQDGKELLKNIEGEFKPNPPKIGDHSTVNFVMNIGNAKFEKAGRYSVELYINDEWKRGLNFQVNKIT